METLIVNRVAQSGIITLNLEQYYPTEERCVLFDIKDYLFMGMILKEKDFREALKQHHWQQYDQQHVGIVCTADAVVQLWAYMLLTAYLQPHAATITVGDGAAVRRAAWLHNLASIDPATYADQRVVVKGCGELNVPPTAYAEITRLLRPVVKSLMYGEPCSTVPIFKAAK